MWWIKIQEGYLRSKESQPHTQAQGSNARKIDPYNFWLWKPAGIELVKETAGAPKQFLLKNPHMGSDSVPLSFSTGVAAWKAPVVYREELKYLASRWAEAIVPFLKLHPQSQQAGAISENPSTWLTVFDQPWRFPETRTHPPYGPTQAVFSMWMAGLGS